MLFRSSNELYSRTIALTWARDEETIAQCGVIAALLEVSGYPKPGNIHRTRNFEDTRYEHFLASSVALSPILRQISQRGRMAQIKQIPLTELKLGESIFNAVQTTQSWQKGGNTNLGIILLFIPLACSAGMLIEHPNPSVLQLRTNLDHIIKRSTSEDTIKLFKAISLANPGGLGTVKDFDIKNTTPESLRKNNINLYDIFKISAGRDSIAKEYITQFQITFEIGYPFFKQIFKKTGDINISIVHTYLKILGEVPDTLIARKFGSATAKEVSLQAKYILNKGGLLTKQSEELLWNFDSELRSEKKINPGTSADLTAAAIMVALLEGTRF